jgi:H+/gluconate symporter-like permease
MMLLGMVLAIPCVIGIVFYAQWLGRKYPDRDDAATDEKLQAVLDTYLKGRMGRPLPGLLISLLPIIVPILLIFIKAAIGIVPSLSYNIGSGASWVISFFNLTGTPIIALSISTLLAVYLLVPYLSRSETSTHLEEGLQSAGIILMVTGAGGALGAVVRESSIGTQLAEQIVRLPLSPIMIPFVVATVIRFIQGSGTVACITSASICAPILEPIPEVNMLFAAQGAVAGAFFFSYFNDSLFWVVNRMMGITDVKQQMAIWSVSTTIAWATGGISVALLNLMLGSGGTFGDLLIPVVGLVAVVVFVKKNSVKI